MNRDLVMKEVTELVAEIAGVDRAAVRPDAQLLGKDIGFDSLSRLRLVVQLDSRFSTRMRAADINDLDLSTIDTIVDYLLR